MMIREKNFDFEHEKLTYEQLEQVNGATNGEYKEIRNLLPMVEYKYLHVYNAENRVEIRTGRRYRDPQECASWLKNRLGIDAKIDVGAWWNPLDSAGNYNDYTRNGQSLTHSEVIAEIKNAGY